MNITINGDIYITNYGKTLEELTEGVTFDDFDDEEFDYCDCCTFCDCEDFDEDEWVEECGFAEEYQNTLINKISPSLQKDLDKLAHKLLKEPSVKILDFDSNEGYYEIEVDGLIDHYTDMIISEGLNPNYIKSILETLVFELIGEDEDFEY